MADEKNRSSQEADDLQRNRRGDQNSGQNRESQQQGINQQDQRREPGNTGQNEGDEQLDERKRAS